MFFLFNAILIATILLVFAYIKLSFRFNVIDQPNYRSSHSIPTTRGAGFILIVVYVASLYFTEKIGLPLLLPVALGLVGFADDIWQLSAKIRFTLFALFLAAFFLKTANKFNYAIGIILIASMVVVWFLSLWWVNLYNFMDGINGLAGCQALFGLIAFFLIEGDSEFNQLLIIMIAAISGFLVWNFPKAKVFLGDSGSLFLAGLLFVLAIKLGICLSAFTILMAVFIADASFTLGYRLLTGQNIFAAHRSHAYQKLAIKFGSHTPVTLGVIAINSFYLLPIAWFVSDKSLIIQIAGVLVAFLPLLIVAIKVGAGSSGYPLPASPCEGEE